jgi:hypothetical protein
LGEGRLASTAGPSQRVAGLVHEWPRPAAITTMDDLNVMAIAATGHLA